MNDTEKFIKGLKENNKELMEEVLKVDIHNHVSYSCNKDYLKKIKFILVTIK